MPVHVTEQEIPLLAMSALVEHDVEPGPPWKHGLITFAEYGSGESGYSGESSQGSSVA